MKKGFTLAEVLITLAVIGIVAALTIPVVMNNYQKKAQYTQFMKMYNTITNIMSLAEAENGTPDTWDYDRNNRPETYKKYIYPSLKVSKMCENSNCDLTHKYKYLGDIEDMESFEASDIFQDGNTVILQDGTWFTTQGGGGDKLSSLQFIFDTNGAKGPNTIGRDLFVVYYEEKNYGEWDFDVVSYSGESFCDPNGDENAKSGMGCAGRLLEKGKMDY